MAGQINVTEQASTPDAPSTGRWLLYAKENGWYQEDDQGVETAILTGTSSITTDEAIALIIALS